MNGLALIPALSTKDKIMSKGKSVLHAKDCEFCGNPLPLERNISTTMHPECRKALGVIKTRERRKTAAEQDKMRQRSKRRWQNITPEEIKKGRERHKEINRLQRNTVIFHYGGKCACCGEVKIEFLCIDHINGNGNSHRKEIGNNIYRWLIDNNFPQDFRVLCHNCNMSLGLYGYCPHQR